MTPSTITELAISVGSRKAAHKEKGLSDRDCLFGYGEDLPFDGFTCHAPTSWTDKPGQRHKSQTWPCLDVSGCFAISDLCPANAMPNPAGVRRSPALRNALRFYESRK
jgi:hypothetical protein